MGRQRGGKRKWGRNNRGAGADETNKKRRENDSERKGDWAPIIRENEFFQKYYKGNKVIPEDKIQEVFDLMVQDLSSTFRLSEGHAFSSVVERYFAEKLYPTMKEAVIEGENVTLIRSIPFYRPDGYGWVIEAPRNVLKKVPEYSKLRQFLIDYTETGHCSRQEMVSMIPPLVLDVQAHHSVLDMCASPGSKTTQILQKIESSWTGGGPTPTGFVIANDADLKRCYTLVHQINRMSSANAVVTNWNAQSFPLIKVKNVDNFAPSAESIRDHPEEYLLFDRVLADVPCSGDGTFRKNLTLWKKWKPALGLGLHKLQIKIAWRGVYLLKVGGRMVYSTCSLNPVENESVVATILEYGGDALELVDVKSELPDLKCEPGISSWRILDNNCESWYDTYDDVPNKRRFKVVPSMFPPENADSLNLDRCARVYPYHHNAGGFFIAIFQKKGVLGTKQERLKEMSLEKEAPTTSATTTTPTTTTTTTTTTTSSSSSSDPAVIDAAVDAVIDAPASTDIPTTPVVEEAPSSASTEAAATTEAAPVAAAEAASPSAEAASPATEATPAAAPTKPKRNKGMMKGGESPFLPAETTQADILAPILEFYGVEDMPKNRFFVRSEASPQISYAPEGVMDVFAASLRGAISVVNGGIKTFTKHTIYGQACMHRITSEGVRYIYPFMKKRVIPTSLEDFLVFVKHGNVTPDKVSKEMQESVKDLTVGGFVFEVDLSSFPNTEKVWPFAGFRGANSLRLHLDKRRLGVLKQLLLEEEEEEETNEEGGLPSETAAVTTTTTTPAATTTTTTTTSETMATTSTSNEPEQVTADVSAEPMDESTVE